MLILVTVLALLAAVFLALYLLQKGQAKRLARQLKKLNDEQRTQIVTMSFPSKVNQELVTEINRFLLDKQRTERERRTEGLRLQEAISNISHDMRTPLTAILGYVHLIRSGDLSREEQEKYLGIIEARANSLQKLILDFYDLSRMDEGRYQMQLELVDVNACCLEVLAGLYDSLERSGLTISADLMENAPLAAADPEALRRVYENLFQNAKKHGKGRLSVSSRLSGGTLLLTIANESPYMSGEQTARVFDRTYTASKSRTADSTGLGLAICKSLIEQMGHKIAASYENGVFAIQITFITSK